MKLATALTPIGIVAAVVLMTSAHAQADTDEDAVLNAMTGMWQVSPRGPGGRPGAGPQRGFETARNGQRQGGNFSEGPPPGEGRGRFGPPASGLEDDASDLPGPDIEGLDRGDKMTWAMMTPQGKAAFEAMDPHDLPSNTCLSNGLPSLVGIPDVQEWTLSDGVLTLHYANFNTVRTIHLDGSVPNGPPTLLGWSSGELANGELTVTTTNLTATPGGLGRNAPGSASRSYVERYRLSADGSRITGQLTIRDPEYLTREMVVPINFSRAPDVTEIPDVPCSVEASQRYLE